MIINKVTQTMYGIQGKQITAGRKINLLTPAVIFLSNTLKDN